MANPLTNRSIAVIGAGNLGSALIQGLLDVGVPKAAISVSTSKIEHSQALAEKLGVNAGTSNLEMAAEADLVILATKPQTMKTVLQELAGLDSTDKLFISVAAGISSMQIEEGLQTKPRVIRAMPNTPALVKKGATAISKGRHAKDEDLSLARALFESLGVVVEVEEHQMNLVTGLSGSGPAYVMRFLEAMIDAASKLGLAENSARILATQTLHGAMRLLDESQDTPQQLREKVSSPGGTTVAGLKALSEHQFDRCIEAAIRAASDRADELGKL